MPVYWGINHTAIDKILTVCDVSSSWELIAGANVAAGNDAGL